VLLPLTDAVPTVVPAEQSVGADANGPNTLNVIVPVGLEPEASVEPIDEVAIAVPAVPPAGPTAETEGEALGVVADGFVAAAVAQSLPITAATV